jgi:hypothetical protein
MTNDRTEGQAAADLGLSLTDTLKRSQLISVATDLGEVSVDLLQQPGILRDIPVLGTLASLWDAGRTVRDYLFTKKLFYFLQTLSAVPQQQRLKMVQQLETDPVFGRKVGEEVALLLDRLDAVPKAAMIGKVFKAYCEGSIDSSTLQRLNYAIDKILLTDLLQLPAFLKRSDAVSNTTRQAFVNGGLAYVPEHYASTVIHAEKQLCANLVTYVLVR